MISQENLMRLAAAKGFRGPEHLTALTGWLFTDHGITIDSSVFNYDTGTIFKYKVISSDGHYIEGYDLSRISTPETVVRTGCFIGLSTIPWPS